MAIEPAGDVKTPLSAASEEVAPKTDKAPIAESSPVVAAAAAEESSVVSDVAAAVSNVSTSAVEVASGDNPASNEESNQGAEEASEIKVILDASCFVNHAFSMFITVCAHSLSLSLSHFVSQLVPA